MTLQFVDLVVLVLVLVDAVAEAADVVLETTTMTKIASYRYPQLQEEQL